MNPLNRNISVKSPEKPHETLPYFRRKNPTYMNHILKKNYSFFFYFIGKPQYRSARL